MLSLPLNGFRRAKNNETILHVFQWTPGLPTTPPRTASPGARQRSITAVMALTPNLSPTHTHTHTPVSLNTHLPARSSFLHLIPLPHFIGTVARCPRHWHYSTSSPQSRRFSARQSHEPKPHGVVRLPYPPKRRRRGAERRGEACGKGFRGRLFHGGSPQLAAECFHFSSLC